MAGKLVKYSLYSIVFIILNLHFKFINPPDFHHPPFSQF